MITKFSQVFLFRRAALEDFIAQFPLLAPRPFLHFLTARAALK